MLLTEFKEALKKVLKGAQISPDPLQALSYSILE